MATRFSYKPPRSPVRMIAFAPTWKHKIMFGLPTYAWPFLFATAAALAGWLLAGRVGDDPGSMPGWILYAVALGCVVIGIAAMVLDRVS